MKPKLITPLLGFFALFAGLILSDHSSHLALASIPPTRSGANQKSIELEVLRDMKAHSSAHFGSLIQDWKTKYAAEPDALTEALRSISLSQNQEDTYRYIGVFGLHQLGLFSRLENLKPFLKDSSWMIRNAALKVIQELNTPAAGELATSLMNDPALVVRAQAVETVGQTRPQNALSLLLKTLEDPSNYQNGKAFWIPQKTLQLLPVMRTSQNEDQILRALKPLLKHKNDETLQKNLHATLESITRHRMPSSSHQNSLATSAAWFNYLDNRFSKN